MHTTTVDSHALCSQPHGDTAVVGEDRRSPALAFSLRRPCAARRRRGWMRTLLRCLLTTGLVASCTSRSVGVCEVGHWRAGGPTAARLRYRWHCCETLPERSPMKRPIYGCVRRFLACMAQTPSVPLGRRRARPPWHDSIPGVP
jgi:hypothetical protein